MPWSTVGLLCALVAPMCWAGALILYRRTPVAPLAMSTFKNTLAIVLLAVTLVATGTDVPTDRPLGDWLRLAASGVLGLAVADTFVFAALHRVGAARVALVDTVYAPLVMGLSWLVLGETMSAVQLAGAAAVIGGVSIATLHFPLDRSGLDLRRALDSAALSGDRRTLTGMLFALGGVSGTAFGVILTKPVLERSDLVEVVLTRLVAGTIAQVAWSVGRRDLAPVLAAFRAGPAWRTLVPAAILGTYLSLLFWLGGFKWADVSVAAVLNQLGSVYTLVLAHTVLGETLTPRQVGASAIAVAGAALVALG